MPTPPSSPQDAVQALLIEAQTLLDADNLDAGRAKLEQVLALDPANVPALNGLARVALKQKRNEEARDLATRAVQLMPVAGNVVVLAHALLALGALDDALKYYLMILDKAPHDLPSLVGAAEIYGKTGRRVQAAACLEKFLSQMPRDIAILRRITKLYEYSDSERLLALYERAWALGPMPLKERLVYLSDMVVRQEAAERFKRGLPWTVEVTEDLSFRFAEEKLRALEETATTILEQEPAHANALDAKASCLLVRGARKESEEFYHKRGAVAPGSLYETIMFDPAFYDRLLAMDNASLLEGFPAVNDLVPGNFVDAPIIFLSCDIGYFRLFTRYMLLSINRVAPGMQVHVHVMNADAEGIAEIKAFHALLTDIKVAVSVEDATQHTRSRKAAKNYFHAVRFIRMVQYLERYQKPLWLMDVDGLMNRDPRVILDSIGESDVALCGHAGRMEPWSRFNASTVGIRPTARGVMFLRLVASYISHFWRKNQISWGIDQLAMYGVFEFLRAAPEGLAVKYLPPELLDGDYSPEGVMWTNGTTVKFTQSSALMDTKGVVSDSPNARYLVALRGYAALLP